MSNFVKIYHSDDCSNAYCSCHNDNGGIIKEEYFINDNKIEGEYKKYYPSGALLKICNYIDGKRNGEYRAYTKNGQLLEERNYINNKLEGEYKFYHNEKLDMTCHYSDNKKNGKYISYYNNGKHHIECNYINDCIDGEYKACDYSGFIADILFYKMGKITHQYKITQKKGNIKCKKY